MRAALLSAGPSLVRTYDPDAKYDLRIGVNTAVQKFACDWWSVADGHRFIEIDGDGTVIGKPDVWMIDAQHLHVQCYAADRYKAYRFHGWDATFDEVGASRSWANASAPCALILARSLGATEVDCYGVDMAGGLDVSGKIDGSTHYRNEKRWELERGLWHLIVEWLQNRGTTVRRINDVLTRTTA